MQSHFCKSSKSFHDQHPLFAEELHNQNIKYTFERTRTIVDTMSGSKPKLVLYYTFVLCAFLVSMAQFYGSTLILSITGNSSINNDSSTLLKITASNEFSNKATRKSSQSEGGIIDADGVDCRSFLEDFRNGKIKEMEKAPGWEKSFVTRTITPKPFYWSTHKPELDTVRASSYAKGAYYEKQLSLRIQETFDAKHAEGKESIFLDVGGNIGWFSLLAAAHGATKVYTFEPNPANVVRICESLSLNNWLRDDRSKDSFMAIAKGVGSKVATQKLYRVNPENPGSYSFSRAAATRFRSQGDFIEEEIDIITLDDFAERHGWFESKPSIGFFKLDVEGFEPPIMRGAKKLFKSRIVELFAMEMKPKLKRGEKNEILELVLNSGYDLYMHGEWRGPNKIVEKKYESFKDLADDIYNKTYGENLLFRKREDWVSTE